MIRISRFRVAAAVVLCLALAIAGCSSSEDRAQSHYMRGVELAEKGDPVKAALEFRNALKLKSDYVDALFGLGEVQEMQGQFQNAIRQYAAVAERKPDHLEARIRLANILLAGGRVDEALDYADQAFKINADDPSVLVTKAAIELKRGNREEAVALANQALEKKPDYVDALMVLAADKLRSQEPEQALALLDKAPEASERNVALQLLRLTALEVLGDQPGVENLFAKMIDLFPDNPAFRQGLVQWYMSKGRKEDAERTLRSFAESDPQNEIAQFGLLSFLQSQKGPEAAIVYLEGLVAKQEIAADLRFRMQLSLAQLKFSTGDRDGATEIMQSVVDSYDGENRNRARIAYAQMEAAEENYEKAESLVNLVIEEDAKNPDALGVRAQIKLATGRSEQASDDLIVAVNEAPQNARLRVLLGDSYEKAGKVTLAEDSYAKALALNDDPADAGLRMARFLLRYGRTARARQVLEDVATRVPNDRRILALLGDVRLATQDWVGAEEIAKKLRALDQADTGPIADRIAAAALSGMDRHTESINLLKSSLDTSGEDINTDLVRAYVQAGELEEAEAYLNKQLEANPDSVRALVLLGSIYASSRRLDEAEKIFQKAAGEENGEVGSTALAQFYASTGRIEEAEKTAREGIAKNPSSNALRFLLSAILQREERFDDAIAIYEEMFARDPESTAIANDLASLLSERRGDPASLDRAFEIAQRFQNSEIPQYLDTLAWIHYLRGDYPSALPLVKSAAERLPDVGLVQFHLGMVQKELGQTEESIESLKRAISLPASMTASDMDTAKEAVEKQEEASASN